MTGRGTGTTLALGGDGPGAARYLGRGPGVLLGTRPMSGHRATIRRGLAEVWDTQGRKFVTFEPEDAPGRDADRWIQFLDGELNVRWPLAEDPRAALARSGVRLPRGAAVRWFVADENALIDTGDAPIDDVAELIDALFARIVAPAPGTRLVARVDVHG